MRRFSILGAAVLALAPAVQAESGPYERLAKMSQAARAANYVGVIVYRGDEALETMRVTHRFQDGVERERVESLTGEPRETLKQDSRVTCLVPKNRKPSMERPTPKGLFPQLTRERLQMIARVYEFDDLGEQRVAGRRCLGIAITPRDRFRYGYEVWADAETHVPLRVDLIGHDGAVLEQMMFSEVAFPQSIPDVAFQTRLDPAQYQEVTRVINEPAASPPDVPGWQFGALPPGYRVTLRDVRAAPNGRGKVEHLMLSDGLSSISIFSVRRESAAPPRLGLSQRGALNAYGRMSGRFQITVVGEAPAQTVQMIGDAVQPAVEAAVVSDSAAPDQARRP